jgi:hypothetical protein
MSNESERWRVLKGNESRGATDLNSAIQVSAGKLVPVPGSVRL